MTNWPAIIAHLTACGLRQIDIAVYCERSENWVGYLRRGVIKQPTYEQGRLLLELAAAHGYVSQETQDHAVEDSQSG